MPEVNETVAAGLAAYHEFVAEQLHMWADPLSNEQFWRKPYPYGNSVGHLVLHLTGNLNYYIGARVAETGYVRDRDREFTDQQPPPKEEALRAFDRTIAMVVATIRKQKTGDWGKSYTAEREPEAADRDREFTDQQPPPKEEALRAFDRTIAMVVATIRKQKTGDWGKAYTAEREPEAADRFQIFLRCAGHAYHHVGQIVYLSRELART